MAKKMPPSKSAPKGKPTVGKAVKKSAGNPTAKGGSSNAKKMIPTKAKAKTGGGAEKKVIKAKKAVPVQKKAVASKTGKGVVQKPVKTSLVKKASATPAPKTPLNPTPKAPAKSAVVRAIVAPKSTSKADAIAPKAEVKVGALAKAPSPVTAKPVAPAKSAVLRSVEAPKTSAAVAEQPVAKAVPAKKGAAKERVVMEFYLRSTPTALYELISNPSGFSEWYCDDVDVRGDQYTFIWDQEREVTTLIGRKLGEVIRFRRNDDEDPEAFFEFRVRIDAMTNETALVVTDHAWPNEVDKTRNLWASQIHSLQRVLGA